MKAKLIKDNDGYWLDISDDGITKRPLTDFGQLSIKNCEAIANGYGLDELVKTTFPSLENCGVYLWMSETDRNRQRSAFIKGFQKALEILGDKKFSINEVVELCKILMSNPFETSGKTYQELTDNYIQSLQQTEWDVEVEKENVMHDYNGNISLGAKFKLDADGCLILKRI